MRLTSSPMPLSFTGESPKPQLRDSRWWWVLAAVSVVVLIVVTIVVARSAWAPRTPWDENGVLMLARVIAGDDDVPLMMTRGYYPATSFLVAPVYWFTHDPLVVYGWANGITNVVGLATILPLIGIARRVGLNLPQAITASAIALCMPGHTGLSDYVLTEQPLQLFVAVAMYAALRFWETPRWGSGALLVGSSLLALFTHPRAMIAVVVAGIWLAGLLIDRTRRIPALIALALLVPGALLTKAVGDHMAALIIVGDFGQGASLFQALTDPNFFLIGKITVMQTWAQMVGTLGMISLGLVVVSLWTYVEIVRRRGFGPGVFIFGMTVGGAVISFLNWSTEASQLDQGNPRFDSWVYTRYIDPFVTVAVLLAIAALFMRLSWPVIASALAFTGVWCLVAVYVFGDSLPTWGSSAGPGNIAALRGWDWSWPTEAHEIPLTPTFTSANRFWLLASVTTFAAQLVSALASRHPRLLAGGLIGAYGAYSLVSNPELARETPYRMERAIDEVEQYTGGAQVSIDFDIECGTNLATRETTINWLGYWFAPRDVDVIWPSEEEADAEVIVACAGWERADEYGAVAVIDSNNYGYEVWVPEGALQDVLVATGYAIER
ncbi:hypothetical protein [Demequina pelophila]|uniref:hypothetical protein n=1 Tax=Demequina pelophila TaxID=1638984 RepID=UPI000785B661|nr:hypothetical protein [Demequina pelophila]